MKPRLRFRFIGALVVTLLVAGMVKFPPLGPRYIDRPLIVWLEDSSDGIPFEQASEAERTIRTNAFPMILTEYFHKEPAAYARLREWSEKLPEGWPRLRRGDERREWALRAIQRLGPQAEPLVPDLNAKLRDSNVTNAMLAVEALRFIGTSNALVSVASAIVNPSWEIRAAAASVYPVSATNWTDLVLPLMSDTNEIVRLVVIHRLESQAIWKAGVIDAVIPLFADPDRNVRFAAVYALRRQGSTARVALPKLRELAAGDDRLIQRAARFTIKAIEDSDTDTGL